MKKPKIVLAIILLFFAINTKAQSDTCHVKPAVCIYADIVFVADWSSSVFNQKAYIVNAARTLSENFVLANDGIKMGLVTFNDKGTVIIKCSGD